jgi:hypothetical protein
MELNEFKKAWQKATSDKIRGEGLDASKINDILSRRSKGILSRLDRSVKIGMWFLVIFFLLTLADQLLPADLFFPDRFKDSLEVPKWISYLEWFVNIILMLTVLFFVIRYRQLQLQTLANQDLKGAIGKVLKLLDTFKKGFYIAVFILMSGICLSFLSGAHKGLNSDQISQASTLTVFIVLFSMLILLGLLIGSIFFIFHKGFNVLFGKYQDQLIQSLNELQENEE